MSRFAISYRVDRVVRVIVDADDIDDAGDVAHTLSLLKPASWDEMQSVLMGRDPHVDDAHTDFRVTFVAKEEE